VAVVLDASANGDEGLDGVKLLIQGRVIDSASTKARKNPVPPAGLFARPVY
jgi:hypothetical protein